MKVLHLAGAAALCGALLLTACAKKTDQSTTSSTDNSATTQSADASPAADATGSTTTTTTDGGGTSVSTSSGNGTAAGFIDIPVYPGASSNKDEGISVAGNGGSVTTKVYTTNEDSKTVCDWYKAHVPSSWQNSIITAGGKTMGTFVDEHKNGDGDQSIIVTSQDDKTTRVQLTTKHGK